MKLQISVRISGKWLTGANTLAYIAVVKSFVVIALGFIVKNLKIIGNSKTSLDELTFRARSYKTFSVRKLRIFVIS